MVVSLKPGNKPAASGTANTSKTADTQTATKPKTSGAPSWMKSGKAAHQSLEQAKLKAEQAKEAANSSRRFFLRQSEEATVTFLDGTLLEGGLLDMMSFYEHEVWNGKSVENYVCVAENEECPICAAGTESNPLRPSWVALFTIIQHEYKDSKGTVHKNQRKLFVAKRDTLDFLNKQAVKRGGLRGAVFNISRSGDKSPKVGSNFEFENKMTEAELKKAYGDDASPIDYNEAIKYRDGDALRKLGIGKTNAPIGSEAHTGSGDLDGEL